MIRLTVEISIPEHFHAEDDLSNLLQDRGCFDSLVFDINNTIMCYVASWIDNIEWSDVQVVVRDKDNGTNE